MRENLIDRMEVAISNYLIKMTDQELGDDESHAVTELLNFVTEFERIGDYAVNIMEKAEELNEKEASFSESAQKELILLEKAVERILTVTGEAFEGDDTQKAMQVEPLEEVIDVMVERLRDQHIRRLKDGVCSIDTGVVFLDVLNNVERISDHCSNVAVRMIGMEGGEDYDSHTLKSIMHHNPTKDYMLEYEQCRKEYLVPLEQMEAWGCFAQMDAGNEVRAQCGTATHLCGPCQPLPSSGALRQTPGLGGPERRLLFC